MPYNPGLNYRGDVLYANAAEQTNRKLADLAVGYVQDQIQRQRKAAELRSTLGTLQGYGGASAASNPAGLTAAQIALGNTLPGYNPGMEPAASAAIGQAAVGNEVAAAGATGNSY